MAKERTSARDLAVDSAILDRVIGALDDSEPSSLARVAAALRALAQVGDLRADVAAGLITEREAAKIAALDGQGATDRVVLERALGIEAQLRKLAEARREPIHRPRGLLRVIAVDQRAGALSAKLLDSFVITTLTHLVARQPPAAGPPRGGTRSSSLAPSGSARTYSTASPMPARPPAPAWCSPTGRCRPGPAADRPGERRRRVHAARERGGGEGGERPDRLRAPVRHLPADRDRRHVGHRHGRHLLHQHGRRLRLDRVVDQRHRVDVGMGSGYSRTGGRRGHAVRRRPVAVGSERDVARDERVRPAHRGDQHQHRLGSVHLAGDRGQRVARPFPPALAGTAGGAVRAAAAARPPP